MKTIVVILLVASSLLGVGCSRPTEEAPVVATSPTPRVLTEEEQRKEEAAREELRKKKEAGATQAAAALPMVQAASPIPATSPTPTPR